MYLSVQFYHKRDAAQGPAPAVEGRLLNSGELFSLSESRGRPLVVHFWATWCSVCRLEQGTIESVAEDHALVAIASQSGTEEDVTAYLREHDLSFPVLVDTAGRLAKQYGVNAFPTTFILDQHGYIRHVEVGYTTEVGMRLRLALADW